MGPRIASRIMITTLFVAGIIGFLLLTSGCEIKATVAGEVYMNKKPMANFTVELWTGNTMVRSEKTNQQGHYIITDVPPGEYIVKVLTYAGVPHPNYEGHIDVRPGRTEELIINLGGAETPELKPPG